MKNTRISCDNRDIFPAVNSVDRPVSSVINKWKKEVFYSIIPEIGKKCDQLKKDGIVAISPDYDHSVPYWERMFKLGFCGLLKESEEARKAKALTDEQDAFFEGIRITYTALIDFIGRLEKKQPKLKEVKDLPHLLVI